jgi:nucleoside-diphosphate kinase
MGNYTLTIIKPDAYHVADQITKRIAFEGFRVISMKAIMLTKNIASVFYSIHKGKDFYNDLIQFMTSGPIVIYALEKENAVDDFRNLIGSTDPIEAKPGTIRSMYGKAVSSNAIHGSDSDDNAKKEILFFFPEIEQKIK